MDDLAGLMHRSPGYAVLMLIFLLSLAGIPPTAGFIGKYYIFLSLIETGHYVLAVVAALVRGGGDLLLLPHRAQHVRRAKRRISGPLRYELRPARGAGDHGRDDAGDRHISRAVPAVGADRRPGSVSAYVMESILQHPLFVPLVMTLVIIVCVFPLLAGYIVLVERKVLADFQVRPGPDARGSARACCSRIADAVKLLLKEDIIPSRRRQGHLLAGARASRLSPR